MPVVVGALQSSQAVVDGVRRPEPPDSKPSPESRVFASTTFSTAGVTALLCKPGREPVLQRVS